MQEPQSSSTLNHYISSGQNNHDSSQHHQEENSSCVECQHIIKIEKQSASDSQSDSSSHDDGELVQPLHRHIIEHSRQIQATITQLQLQIQKLKNANSSKDILIQQLKKQLKQVQVNSKISHSLRQDAREVEFLRRQKEIQKIRNELYESSQNLVNTKLKTLPLNASHEHNDQNSINEDLKRRIKKVEVMFEDRSKKKGSGSDGKEKRKKVSKTKKISIKNDSISSEESQDQQNHHIQQRSVSYEHEKRQKTSSKVRNLKNNHFEKKRISGSDCEENSGESSIEHELNQHYEKITRLENHIQFCEDEMLWMTNFIIAFLRMSEKLMGNFNEPVLKHHWNMKKKTKIAWGYIKHILSYLMP